MRRSEHQPEPGPGPRWDTLWTGVHLATMTGPGLGVIRDGAVASLGDRIAWVGKAADLPRAGDRDAAVDEPRWDRLARDVVHCGGAWATPGLIDCHTHIVFGGDRADEFRRRLRGESYEAIARAGGGIWSTVKATRRASVRELANTAAARAEELMAWGVTTVEVKSGYGLDTKTELKMLEAAAKVGRRLPLDVVPTLLAAHALPPEFAENRAEYLRLVTEEMIPAALEQGVATAVDVFCERVAFSADESRTVLEAGMARGLNGRIHADQLADTGGGKLAASVKASSADHLEYLSDEGAAAMAAAGVAAVLLPGAAYTLRETRAPPVDALRREGVPIAVATDANPGSSPITNVGMILNLACIQFGLVPEEALRGITRSAAQVLDLDSDRGTLEVGKRADLAIWNIRDPALLAYWAGGRSPLSALVKDGKAVRLPR